MIDEHCEEAECTEWKDDGTGDCKVGKCTRRSNCPADHWDNMGECIPIEEIVILLLNIIFFFSETKKITT